DEAVAGTRTAATGVVSAGSMGQPATPRSAGVVGSTEPDYRGTESGHRAGSRKVPRSAATDDSSRCRPTHRAGLCADHWESRAVSGWEADCELSRTGAAGKVQRKSETAGSHHQTREFMVRFLLVEAAQVTVRSLPEWRRKYVQLMMRRGRGDWPLLSTGCGARDGITSSQKVRFARGPARNRRWCAVEHRVIEWAARSSSRRSSK